MKLFSFIKKLGLIPLYSIGGIIITGTLGLGVVATVFEDDAKQAIKNFAGSTSDSIQTISTTLTNISSQIEISSDDIQTSLTNSVTILENSIKEMESVKEQITDETTKTQIENIINQINKLNIQQIVSEVSSSLDNVENTINKDAIPKVQEILNSADSLLGTLQDENGDVWKYYGIVSSCLIIVSSVILGALIIGLVWRAVFYKKVDGVYFKRRIMEKAVYKHIKKIIRKYPNLRKVIDEYDNI